YSSKGAAATLDQTRHSPVWNMKIRHNQVCLTAVRENRATNQRNPILRVTILQLVHWRGEGLCSCIPVAHHQSLETRVRTNPSHLIT
ncbi:MAG: hypothetical protein ACPGK3_08845, partial [Paracoccaceae bacterium]